MSITRIQVLVVSRLVLNLRQRSTNSVNDSLLATISEAAQPEFASNSILGNIGAPLMSNLDDMVYEEN